MGPLDSRAPRYHRKDLCLYTYHDKDCLKEAFNRKSIKVKKKKKKQYRLGFRGTAIKYVHNNNVIKGSCERAATLECEVTKISIYDSP